MKIHTFQFIHDKVPHYFLWDTESGSLSIIDYPAFLCVKNKYYGETSSDFEALDNKTVADIFAELDALEKKSALNAKAQAAEFSKDYAHLKALCLHICHDCNLSCDYCFAGGGKYNTASDYMTEEVGHRAVDLLIANSGKRQNLELDFFGGEPLMNLDVVKSIVSYAKKQGERFNKTFAFTMTTNCLLLNSENIEYLNREMDNVVLSIDGRKCTHNRVRHSLNGKDVYGVVLDNAQKMKTARNGKRYYVRGTFTSENLDFASDVLHLADLGFDQISVEPVVLPEGHRLALTESHLEKICAEYDKLACAYIDRQRSLKNRFNFFHFMIDLEHGPCLNKRLTGCGAGTEYLAVTPTGGLYPCHRFAGKEEYKIGDVFEGKFNDKIRAEFAKNTVLTKKHCEACFAKYYCGGGCVANSIEMCGGMDGQYKIGCDMTKKRMELSLAIAAIFS